MKERKIICAERRQFTLGALMIPSQKPSRKVVSAAVLNDGLILSQLSHIDAGELISRPSAVPRIIYITLSGLASSFPPSVRSGLHGISISLRISDCQVARVYGEVFQVRFDVGNRSGKSAKGTR